MKSSSDSKINCALFSKNETRSKVSLFNCHKLFLGIGAPIVSKSSLSRKNVLFVGAKVLFGISILTLDRSWLVYILVFSVYIVYVNLTVSDLLFAVGVFVFFRAKPPPRPIDLLIAFEIVPVFWGAVGAVFLIVGLHVILFASMFLVRSAAVASKSKLS